ncbi:MAG: hypothetical protein EHM53_02985 [Methanoregulaceae archaeon]|nr:MAG: hypothetical protein EHM53_02985 [Methanoregulaceae archaeon]
MRGVLISAIFMVPVRTLCSCPFLQSIISLKEAILPIMNGKQRFIDRVPVRGPLCHIRDKNHIVASEPEKGHGIPSMVTDRKHTEERWCVLLFTHFL